MNKKLEETFKKVNNGNYTFSFHHDGNFTVCLLYHSTPKKGKLVAVGVTKRNPNLDEYDETRGENIALARAVKKIVK